MKVQILLLLAGVALVACQGRNRQNGNSGRRRPTSGDDGSGARFPDYFRVEIEVERLDNGGGILSNGKRCDYTGACDPIVKAFLDADSPLSPWPGTSLPVKKWPTIFQVNNVNSPSIHISVNKDTCGGSMNQVNLRVNVVDSDVASGNDEIGNFECLFTIDPRDIAGDASAPRWGPSTQCKSQAQQDKIKLFVKQRAYQVPAANCAASGSSSGGRQNSDLSASPGAHVPGQHDFVRVEAEIVTLLNPQGLLATKKNCDSFSKCDPKITVYMDTDKPFAAWPGSKTVPEYAFLFSANNVDSPIINKNVSKNICGGSVGTVNLRVHVVDANSLGSNSLIEDFQCVFVADYRQVVTDVSQADWSATQDCKPQHAGNDIRLQYRYRIYDISQRECGIGVPAKKG